MAHAAQAIETRYAGYRFRSRLEARWAVFFDTLGVQWQYEPEGYELGPLADPQDDADRVHLGYYLPDFYLPELNAWFEVKGQEYTGEEWDKLARLTYLTDRFGYLAWGDIPRGFNSYGHENNVWPKRRDIITIGDEGHAWCLCPWCGKPGIEYEARAARVCGWERHAASEDEARAKLKGYSGRVDDRMHNATHPRLIAACEAARSARFEYGESGAR